MAEFTYDPQVFRTPDLDAARRIILTPHPDQDTDERWARETPYVAQLAAEQLALGAGSLVIDYGCGVGRVAKALIERCGCTVLGVDISNEMRALAPAYVASPRFSVVSRGVFDGLVGRGLRADAAIAVWVLQHCHRPDEDVALLRAALGPEGGLFVLNTDHRAIPTVEGGWVADGIDVPGLLDAGFVRQAHGRPDPAVVGAAAEKTFWARYAPR